VVRGDLDREVAELVVLQNAYAANARVMQTITQMMDTLIDMVR
jgi:flagellar hook-associated protein 1